MTAAALPYKQRAAEKKIATKQKRIVTKLKSELEGFFKPDTIFDAEAREAARDLQERARETLLAGTTTWGDLHEEVAAIRKGDMYRAAALKPEPVAEAAPEAVSEAQPKPRRERRRATPTPEPVAEAAPEAVAPGDVLYQGHKGPGIGCLKTDLPERRDGDGDTVVAERRPRQSDLFGHSSPSWPLSRRDRGRRREANEGTLHSGVQAQTIQRRRRHNDASGSLRTSIRSLILSGLKVSHSCWLLALTT